MSKKYDERSEHAAMRHLSELRTTHNAMRCAGNVSAGLAAEQIMEDMTELVAEDESYTRAAAALWLSGLR